MSSSPSKAAVASLSKNFYPHCLVIVNSRNRFKCDLHEQPEGNADPALKPNFYIFLLIFQHKWMFLSTMQTLPNQIPLGPAKMISLLSYLVEWGFYSCWICTCQDQKQFLFLRISVCWVFGLPRKLLEENETSTQTTPPTRLDFKLYTHRQTNKLTQLMLITMKTRTLRFRWKTKVIAF